VLYDTSLKKSQQVQLQNVLHLGIIANIEISNNTLWMATDNGMFCNNLMTGANELSKHEMLYKRQSTTGLRIINKEVYYSNAAGTFVYDFATKSTLKVVDELKDSETQQLNSANYFMQLGQSTWVGTVAGIVELKKSQNTFTRYCIDNKSRRRAENVFGLLPINYDIYFAMESGFCRYNINDRRIDVLMEDETVWGVCDIDTNSILVSANQRLFCSKNNKIYLAEKIYSELNPIKNFSFNAIARISTNEILLGSIDKHGMYLWNFKNRILTHIAETSDAKLDSYEFNSIKKLDDNTALLISESAVEIYNLRNGAIAKILDRKDCKEFQFDVFMDACRVNNNYWIAAYGLGIINVVKAGVINKVISNKEGLANTGTYKIYGIGDTMLTVTTNNGICIYKTNQDKASMYYEHDGVANNNFNEASGYQYGDSIYFGGINGITQFNVKQYMPKTEKPKLYFTQIKSNSIKNPQERYDIFEDKIEVPNDATVTTLKFVALNWGNSKRVQYWYRINKISSTWVSLGTQNFIDFIGLSPGEYVVELKAINEEGIFSDVIKLTLNFQPKWYQTTLFKLAVIAAIALILYLLYRFRIRQLKKVFAVRQKISRDLHDDLGSSLSAIKLYTSFSGADAEMSTVINENTTEVIEKLDDIIWASNPKNDKFENLINRIQNFAIPLARSAAVDFRLNYSDSILHLQIDEAQRQCIYLICKEAINNTLKYAAATKCTITLELRKNKIHCSITDDGKGFDTNTKTERNGLFNMKQRVTQLNGTLNIESSSGNGTIINFVLPVHK
jgi:anti-sigma regulatory factor (Ser/Thr protein kinase)